MLCTIILCPSNYSYNLQIRVQISFDHSYTYDSFELNIICIRLIERSKTCDYFVWKLEQSSFYVYLKINKKLRGSRMNVIARRSWRSYISISLFFIMSIWIWNANSFLLSNTINSTFIEGYNHIKVPNIVTVIDQLKVLQMNYKKAYIKTIVIIMTMLTILYIYMSLKINYDDQKNTPCCFIIQKNYFNCIAAII